MYGFKKWEIALMIGVAVTIVWCAVTPRFDMSWWTTAFAPLCDKLLTADSGGEGIVLRSKLWELLSQHF